MTLVIIFGPPAVGKMTVGLELERLTGFRLFHNHMTVDPVSRLFPFGSPRYGRLVGEFRRRIFEEFAASDERGLIFTFVWALDDEADGKFIEQTTALFTDNGHDVCFELYASQDERLRRNETPLRLAEKRALRDTRVSRAFLLDADRRHRLNTQGVFAYPDRHLKIENTNLSPEMAARHVVRQFGLQARQEAG
ncbi:MAG: AAA family ATPase [Vicinamibacterales bacterium]